ncbi:MAG: dihydrofolate reductase family protein [Calditrichota bacterium]
MRNLILQVQMSVDGFVAGPNGELDWMVWDWDDKIKAYVSQLTNSIDTILLGRKMTEGFISYWSNVVKNPEEPEYEFGKKMIDTPKVVFSHTLDKISGPNIRLAKGDLSEEINRLKKQPGKDIIVYGGASFVSSLIRNKLIDEYHLFTNPVAIGQGLSIFGKIDDKLNLNLVKTEAFPCGIVVHQYRPEK